jgi:excisionase family DNA binding protein
MLTVKQTAGRLNVSESTVYALIKNGLLRSHRVGVGRGVIRVSESAIAEYLDSAIACASSRKCVGCRPFLVKIKR